MHRRHSRVPGCSAGLHVGPESGCGEPARARERNRRACSQGTQQSGDEPVHMEEREDDNGGVCLTQAVNGQAVGDRGSEIELG